MRRILFRETLAGLHRTYATSGDLEQAQTRTLSIAIKELIKKQPFESRNTQDGHPVEQPIGV